MTMGPLELVVLACPGPGLAGGVRGALDRAQRAGDVRIVDALLVVKDADGKVAATELSDVAELREVAEAYELGDRDTAGLIDTGNADEVGTLMPPDSTALALLVERRWARDVAEAPPAELTAQLGQLAQLREKNLLTQEEYEAAKSRLLRV